LYSEKPLLFGGQHADCFLTFPPPWWLRVNSRQRPVWQAAQSTEKSSGPVEKGLVFGASVHPLDLDPRMVSVSEVVQLQKSIEIWDDLKISQVTPPLLPGDGEATRPGGYGFQFTHFRGPILEG